MWESENELVGPYGHGKLDSRQRSIKTAGFELRDRSWYVATDVPSDLVVQIGDINFHLHKNPLLSRSGKMNRIIREAGEHANLNKVVLDDLPGGPGVFELAAKFCYGVAVDLTAANISGLRCVAEYLEMTEDLEEGNLIFKTEAFLSYVVLSSWRDSIIVLKSCEKLSPWAENLQIVRRCSESIAWKACANPKGIRWAYTATATTNTRRTDFNQTPMMTRNQQIPADWWFEDVSILRIDHFVRVVTAIKAKGMGFQLIGAAIVHYADKWLPGLIKQVGDEENSSLNPRDGNEDSYSSSSSCSWKGGLHMVVASDIEDEAGHHRREQRTIIESLISILPAHKDSVSCSFLLRLLRMANMLKVAPALATELEKRVGMQLEEATLPDLLVPCYGKSESLYDVDLVQRLLEHFLVQEQTESPNREPSFLDNTAPNSKATVARLVDSYLTEVSRDRSLSLTKFQVLAETLPDSARSCDDGLYRAIDSYLKAHPGLAEHERKRLCRVMDCQKLSMDACMHAAQNERLPLRVVVQVLFSEQLKISNAVANSSLEEAATTASHAQLAIPTRKTLLEGTPQSFQEGWSAAKKDINTLKFEIESVKGKYVELQNDMETLQRQFDKMSKQKQTSGWAIGLKKLSRFTRMTAVEGSPDIGVHPQINNEEPRKNIKRWRNTWRNSIS